MRTKADANVPWLSKVAAEKKIPRGFVEKFPWGLNKNMREGIYLKCILIPLMEEILHHLGFIKLVNNGINYLSTGAGFLPATATHDVGINFLFCRVASFHVIALRFFLHWNGRKETWSLSLCRVGQSAYGA